MTRKISAASESVSGNLVWAKAMGPSVTVVKGLAIAIDRTGNVYTTGFFLGSVDFDPGPAVVTLTAAGFSPGEEDIFICKLNNFGNFVWAKGMGATSQDEGTSLNLDTNGNIYTTGYFSGIVDFDPGPGSFTMTSVIANQDCFILKLDNSGNFVWAKQIGGAGIAMAYSSKLDPKNNIYTTGLFAGPVDFDPGSGTYNVNGTPGGNDIFVFKLDSSGNFKWAKTIGSSGADRGSALVLDPIGNLYYSGYFSGAVDFNPDAGTAMLYTAGSEDVFISKLDTSGNFVWAKGVGGNLDDAGNAIALDASDNVYVTGSFLSSSINFGIAVLTNAMAGAYDIFIAKLGAINTGIENNTPNETVYVYPNPATNLLHLTLTKPLPHNTPITIIDMQGRVVKEVSKITPGGDAIDVSTLTQGVYLLKVNGQVQRFVKMD